MLYGRINLITESTMLGWSFVDVDISELCSVLCDMLNCRLVEAKTECTYHDEPALTLGLAGPED